MRRVVVGQIFLVVALLAAFTAGPVASASHLIPFYCNSTSSIGYDYVYQYHYPVPPASSAPGVFAEWDMNGGTHDGHTDRLRTTKTLSGCVETHSVGVVGRLFAAEEGTLIPVPSSHARGYVDLMIIFSNNVLITSVDTDGGNAQIVAGGIGNGWVILRVDPENFFFFYYLPTAKEAHPVRVTADIPSSYWGSTIQTDFWLRYYSQWTGQYLFTQLNSEFTPA